MEKITLLKLTRDVLDLKTEKKNFNREINERIKDLEAEIKLVCAEDKTF